MGLICSLFWLKHVRFPGAFTMQPAIVTRACKIIGILVAPPTPAFPAATSCLGFFLPTLSSGWSVALIPPTYQALFRFPSLSTLWPVIEKLPLLGSLCWPKHNCSPSAVCSRSALYAHGVFATLCCHYLGSWFFYCGVLQVGTMPGELRPSGAWSVRGRHFLTHWTNNWMHTDSVDGLSIWMCWGGGQSLFLFQFGCLATACSSSWGKESDQMGPVWLVERVDELSSVFSPPTSFLRYFCHLVPKACHLVFKNGGILFALPIGKSCHSPVPSSAFSYYHNQAFISLGLHFYAL